MTITKTTTPYEFLARWDATGKLAGAHVGFLERITDGAEVLSEKALPVQPVGDNGFPLADIMSTVQADALAAVEAAKAETKAAEDAQKAAEDAKATADAELVALKQTLATVAGERDAARAELEAVKAPPVDADGVPSEVTKRQGKTLMELTPHPAGNLWLAALAAIETMQDATQRIVLRNYLIDSQVYERARVRQMAGALFGMTEAQADQMMVEAAKL